ncbi:MULTISPECIES: ABC transporter substrate-binding protein [Modicisalibacter]|uniref:ABC transporter substrate-binding protein n=1 Tax=Modicisalibacter TaxID=574347 RepID=UPI001CCF50AF|nr:MULTISPECIES: ABC transporter substrate-binding protein [Modicisalibacter]MBZ9538896.1 peptide ABC transporter substrate-binding protein [Modicisalibacter tunisiensis]MBZ9559601.1 peptide ABC transporter substrate-binding protein [Modicisalibacter sp. R2A 31.J]MBZ9577053.1 peptide ABC transporter substrate-binding protein [Modicisalibacter sp. MOD 31.J]
MTKTNDISAPSSAIGRRAFLKGSASLCAFAATMPLGSRIWAQSGQTLRVSAYADIDALDPAFYQNAYNVDVMNCIYTKLIRYKAGREWEWELEAAEAIEQVDDTHIHFRLKQGLQFTGGYGEITADDVKFSFERILAHDSPVKGDWGPLDHVEVTGRYEGVIVLKEPFQPIWTIALPYGAGHIVSRKAVMEATADGGNFGMQPPVFSGAYVLAEWKPNQYVKLTRNPDWHGAAPGFDEIRILPMDDTKTAERAYEAGDLDFTRITLSSLAQYRQSPPAHTIVTKYPSLYYVWLGMNLDNPALSDINLRKAIQYAINVKQVVYAAYFGEALPATGLVAPGLPGHREQDPIPAEGDLDKARAYLEAAGGPPKQPLTIDTLNATKWTTMAQVIQAQLAKIGIQTQINVQDSGSFWTLGMESEGDRWKNLQLILNRFSMLPDPYYATSWFVSDQVGVWNWERFSNAEFDKLHQQALKETDVDKRDALYRKMQDLMEASGAYRFLTHEANPVMYRDSLKPALRPDGQPLLPRFGGTV